VGVGPGGVSYSGSQTTTTGDNTTTNTGGVSVNPGNGSVTVSGGTTTNGIGVSGSGTIGPDGVSGSGSVQAGPVSVGLTFGLTHSEVASTVVQGDRTTQVADVLGGGDYIAATRSDEQKLGGTLGVKALTLSADTTSNSTVQTFQKLPPGWATMSPTDRASWTATVGQQQQATLGNVNGLGDVPLDQMQDGTGIRVRTSNGWNAGAGVNYGALSVSMSGGQTTASEVTLAKTNGKFEVSLDREDGLSSSSGAALAGFGITAGETTNNAHQVKFQVDPANPQAMAAMKNFMQTGLLPGADMMTDKDSQAASAKFSSAKGQVDSLNAQIQQLQQPMTQPGYIPNPGVTQQLTQLYAQLDGAQQSLAINRGFLNDRWQAQYGSTPGASPVAGVQVETVTDTRTQTNSGAINTPLGDINAAPETRTWTQRQYVGTGNAVQTQYGFDDKGFQGSEQSVGTDTDPNHVVLNMFTDTNLQPQNAAITRNIQNSDMPSYVADAMAAGQGGGLDAHGRVNVAMTTQQLNVMTASLNDMNNPQSKAMWTDFATRTAQFMSGQDYTIKTGDSEKDYAQALGGQISRNQWYQDLWAKDPSDPLRKAFASYGTDPGQAELAAAQQFAKVKSPAEFQKLTVDQQQLFLSVIEHTSGPVYDLTGQRNSYEALAPAALIHDSAAPQNDAALRAKSMRDLFEETNEQGHHENTDAVLEFVHFTDRFKEDPAAYAKIQQSMAFNWKQGAVDDAAANQSEAQIGQRMHDGATAWFDVFGDGKHAMVDMLGAANKQGGKDELKRVVDSSGMSPADIMAKVGDDPLRQHMVYDLLVSAGYDLTGVPLGYQCPP
jgi:hypothetical protein